MVVLSTSSPKTIRLQPVNLKQCRTRVESSPHQSHHKQQVLHAHRDTCSVSTSISAYINRSLHQDTYGRKQMGQENDFAKQFRYKLVKLTRYQSWNIASFDHHGWALSRYCKPKNVNTFTGKHTHDKTFETVLDSYTHSVSHVFEMQGVCWCSQYSGKQDLAH